MTCCQMMSLNTFTLVRLEASRIDYPLPENSLFTDLFSSPLPLLKEEEEEEGGEGEEGGTLRDKIPTQHSNTCTSCTS